MGLITRASRVRSDDQEMSYAGKKILRALNYLGAFVRPTPENAIIEIAQRLAAAEGDILTGAGAPSDTIGKDGDLYIDTDTLPDGPLAIYGPKADDVWPEAPVLLPLAGSGVRQLFVNSERLEIVDSDAQHSLLDYETRLDGEAITDFFSGPVVTGGVPGETLTVEAEEDGEGAFKVSVLRGETLVALSEGGSANQFANTPTTITCSPVDGSGISIDLDVAALIADDLPLEGTIRVGFALPVIPANVQPGARIVAEMDLLTSNDANDGTTTLDAFLALGGQEGGAGQFTLRDTVDTGEDVPECKLRIEAACRYVDPATGATDWYVSSALVVADPTTSVAAPLFTFGVVEITGAAQGGEIDILGQLGVADADIAVQVDTLSLTYFPAPQGV